VQTLDTFVKSLLEPLMLRFVRHGAPALDQKLKAGDDVPHRGSVLARKRLLNIGRLLADVSLEVDIQMKLTLSASLILSRRSQSCRLK
jgi:hypothetical protein